MENTIVESTADPVVNVVRVPVVVVPAAVEDVKIVVPATEEVVVETGTVSAASMRTDVTGSEAPIGPTTQKGPAEPTEEPTKALASGAIAPSV